jgi:hypothetical protein
MKGKIYNIVVTTSAVLLFVSCLLFLQPAVSYAQNAVSFASATNFALGNNPFSVAVGDFNGDGKLDLAVANGDDPSPLPVIPGRVSILLGNDDGTFGDATNFAVGAVPTSVTVGDFNGDGKLDLAVANFGGNNVSVLLGTGTGSFEAAINVTIETGARFVAVGDFNGDGKLDLAVAYSGDDSVSPVKPPSLSILLGHGDGTFAAPINPPPPLSDGDIPTSLAVGDFNGDGKLDLAVANSGTNDVSILLGAGTGSFGAAATFTVGTGPVFVAADDFDGDGNLDLAVVNSGSNNVSILLGTGTGSFDAAKNFTVGIAPVSVAVGDFNGDGKPDLVVANSGNNKVSLLQGKGNGTFGTATNFSAGSNPWSVAVGDFKTDGKLDLAVTNLRGNNLTIFLGNGTGSFAAPAKNFDIGTVPVSVAVGDFDGDGKLDLATEEVSLLGNGDGTFGAATNYTVGAVPFSVTAKDFNGDSKLDLAVVNAGSNDVSILLGTGTGSFGTATNFAVGTNPVSVAAADFNGDTQLDLAVVNAGSNDVSILLGTGTGSFGAATNFAVGIVPASVTAADFNGDGKLDLAVANAGDLTAQPPIPGSLSILSGNGDGTFGAATNFTVGTKPISVAAADFNGDGKLDLAVVTAGDLTASPAVPGSLSILLGHGDGTFGTATNYAVGTGPATVALGDLNYDGKLDLAVANSGNNNISVFLGKGDGTFVAAPSFDVGTGPVSITVADINGDGRLDLAVANALGRSVSILLNATINPAASHILTVASSNPSGVSMIVTPKDKSNKGNGTTQLTRTYTEGTTVTLTAPATAAGNNFFGWSGCNSSSGTTCNAIMMADKTVTATYAAPLPVAGPTLPDMEVGLSYDTPLVLGGVGPYTFKTTKGTFPSGLSGDPINGHLTGIPKSANKKVSFTVLITDSLGFSVTGAFKATGYSAVSISTKSLKAGTHGKAYKGKLAVAGGKKPFSWSETSGNLTAAGLTLDPATGAITGTPPAVGSFNLNLRVTDSLGAVAQKALSLTIN